MSLSAEVTLTVGNIGRCLKDSVPSNMLRILERELGVPPRDSRGNSHHLTGLKTWLLGDKTASWQKFAAGLYSSTLDEALWKMEDLKLLPVKGNLVPSCSCEVHCVGMSKLISIL